MDTRRNEMAVKYNTSQSWTYNWCRDAFACRFEGNYYVVLLLQSAGNGVDIVKIATDISI